MDTKKISNKIRESKGDKFFVAICYLLLFVGLAIIVYPLIYVVSCSFSDPDLVGSGDVVLFPKGITLAGYQAVFENDDILSGYGNTIFYTVVGTLINLAVTVPAGFALAKEGLVGKKFFVALILIPMYFSGGMVPTYLLVKNLGLYDSRWVMLLMGAFNATNCIICRTFFSGIPKDLREAAAIDGCGTTRYFFQIAIPISQALLGVMVLYFAVGHWNSYFNAMMYMSDHSKYPLQLVLRSILIQNDMSKMMEDAMTAEAAAYRLDAAQQLKFAVIVVSAAPMLIVYPFLQKYFDKGVMIGSLKG